VIYEVRILKSLDGSWDKGSIVTLIEHIKAKNIIIAEITAKKLAKDLEGSLRAVTADPYSTLKEK